MTRLRIALDGEWYQMESGIRFELELELRIRFALGLGLGLGD